MYQAMYPINTDQCNCYNRIYLIAFLLTYYVVLNSLMKIPFLAHLSRRLTGELIGYPWIRRPSVVRRRPSSTFSNISSETAWPIKAKFYVEPPWEGGTKVCINGPGHMTKMAAMHNVYAIRLGQSVVKLFDTGPWSYT